MKTRLKATYKHKLKEIGMRGNLFLFECRDCKDRVLAYDLEEGAYIYSKNECRKGV